MNFVGIEIGGTKLQLALGAGDGVLRRQWRGTIDPTRGAAGIRQQIVDVFPSLVQDDAVEAVGIGFGGPVDDVRQVVCKSHQIDGWDDFPLTAWCRDHLHLPAVVGNDADLAGLGEALHGAGRGVSPLVYVTLGSGIGGGFLLEGKVYRGFGSGAAEIGHLRVDHEGQKVTLESLASGWGIQEQARRQLQLSLTVAEIARRADAGDGVAIHVLETAWNALAEGLCHVIALLAPRRIILGGGVSLLGERLFVPLRRKLAERVFRPFATGFDLVPAQLGEEVVLHGALGLARQSFARQT